jgi:threonine synthase
VNGFFLGLENGEAKYDFARAARDCNPQSLPAKPSMWRYVSLLPLRDPKNIVSLGEGSTPLLRLRRMGFENLWLKDEGHNPGGTCESRSGSCIASVSREQRRTAMTSHPLYAAAAGLEYRGVPEAGTADYVEAQAAGIHAPDASQAAIEPWHTEGLKTIGYEIAEQLDLAVPVAIICPEPLLEPLRKSYDEMQALGWIESGRPQSFPARVGSLREAVDAGLMLARLEGILPSRDGAASMATLHALVSDGTLSRDEQVVVVNPASGLRSLEIYARRFPRTHQLETDKLGGLVTPR